MQVQKPGLKKSLLEAGLRQAGAKPGAFIQDAGTLANKQTIKKQHSNAESRLLNRRTFASAGVLSMRRPTFEYSLRETYNTVYHKYTMAL